MERNAVALLVALVGACAGPKSSDAADPAIARGAASYARYCATCHGHQGYGYVADNAPSLRSPTFLATATDAFLEAAILRGRPGTAMGGYARTLGGPLGPAEAKEVIAFLRVGGPPRVELSQRPSTGDAVAGKVVYDSFCLRCHGSKVQRISAIHLANSVLLETASDAFLRHAIEAGRPPTSMVPWKGALTDKQIEDVLRYIRSFAVPTPPAAPAAPPLPPAAPRTGPIVLNPKGRHPTFDLRDDRFVSIDQVKAAMDDKRRMIIADARAPSEWANLRIAGAISTPYYDAKSLDDIPNDGTWVLAYCACPHHVSGEVVDALRKRGYKHTAVIDEGVFAWQQKGYPIVAAPGALPTPAPPPARLPIPPAPPPARLPIPPAPPAAAQRKNN